MRLTNINEIFEHNGKVIKVTFYRRPTHWIAIIKESDTARGPFKTVHVDNASTLAKIKAEVMESLSLGYGYKDESPIPAVPADLAHRLAAPFLPTGDYRMMVVDHPIG